MKRSGLIAAAAATLIVFGLHQDAGGAASSANTAETYKQLNLFGDVFELVRNDYVAAVKADPRDHQDPVGPLASRRQEYRLYPRHLVQRADRCRPQQCDEEPEAAGR